MKIGILGGGQLGRMLLQQAANYAVETFVLEKDATAPAAALCHHFVAGDITDYDTVLAFGRQVEALTIEIENVNEDALEVLEREGVRVFPTASALRTIKDKGLQKQFYLDHNIATADFILTDNKAATSAHSNYLPVACKLRKGGYDGKGVEIIRTAADFDKAFDAPSVLEKLVHIDKEIAVIVAVGQDGEVAVYPATEMVFDPKYNLVDYLVSPASLTPAQEQTARQLAREVALALASPGIFAVEMFLDKSGEIIVNETAPRAHNSGHHTIEANYSSQYDMQLRILLGLPLGSTDIIQPALMLNVIGAEGYKGAAKYDGLDKVLQIKGAAVHLYGKTTTSPGRKMGHVTLMGEDLQQLVAEATVIKETLRVIA